MNRYEKCIGTNLELHNTRSEVKKRRDLVAALHARSMSETDIEKALKKMGYPVDQTTISRDLKTIKEEIAQQFVFDLARSDLAYYYKQCLDTIDEVKEECRHIYDKVKENDNTPIRDKLAPLALIKDCSESKFKLLSEGPAIMAVKSLEERLKNVEQSFEQETNNNR